MSNNRPINEKELNKESLINTIKKQFPLRGKTEFDDLFPFCNDYGFSQAIEILMRFEANKDENETISLVFGESNFISLLPVLSNISSILLLADINRYLHRHTKFLLECFIKSGSPQEFQDKYFGEENPILNKLIQQDTEIRFDEDDLNRILNLRAESVGKYYFLNNQNVYDECKKALEKMTFLPIHFDVSNQFSCEQFNQILHQYNARLNFCNFTNIGEYSELKNGVKSLLKGHENALILFSSRDLVNTTAFPRAAISLGLQDFLSTDIKKPLVRFDTYIEHMLSLNKRLSHLSVNQQLNLKQPNYKLEKTYGKCYSTLIDYDENDIQNIIEGKLDIYSSNMLPALGSEDQAREVLEKLYQRDKNRRIQNKQDYTDLENSFKRSWILTFFNNLEKVNRYIYSFQNLRLSPTEKYLHRIKSEKKRVRIHNHLKLSSYVCSAQKLDGSVTIEKSMDLIPDKYKQDKYQLKDFTKAGLMKFNANNSVGQDKEVLDEINKLSLK